MTNLILFACVLLVTACEGKSSKRSASSEAQPASTEHTEHAEHTANTEQEDHPGHAATGEPAKLLPMMLQLGVHMNALNDGLFKDDLVAVSKAAIAVADHPHVDAAELTRISQTLGPDMSGFVTGDKRVHEAATRLSTAATAKDMGATLAELGEVQAGCVACHSQFRDRLREPDPDGSTSR